MFGTLRRFAAAIGFGTRAAKTETDSKPVKLYPLLREPRMWSNTARLTVRPNGGKRPRTKGVKSRSLKIRSNRRKAA